MNNLKMSSCSVVISSLLYFCCDSWLFAVCSIKFLILCARLSIFSSTASIRSATACNWSCIDVSCLMVSDTLCLLGEGEDIGGGIGMVDFWGGRNGVGGHLGTVCTGEVAGCSGLKADDEGIIARVVAGKTDGINVDVVVDGVENVEEMGLAVTVG